MYSNKKLDKINSTTKIIKRVCLNSQHNPPSHMVYPSGCIIEHTCPGCGEKKQFSTGAIY